MDDVLLTTGPCIEGYKIQTYHGLVCSKRCFADSYLFNEKEKNETAFDNEIDMARKGLMEKAKNMGANAVIGISFQFYDTGSKGLGIRLIVCLLSGTAVTIIPD